MNKLLKTLGFIGSLAVGIATVNYLVQSSKSDAVSAVVGQKSDPISNPLNTSKKISRFAKIEQSYQPKALEEIPVEYVQIATSDIDEGRKLSNDFDSAAKQLSDKTVKVEQGSASPFLSSRPNQPNMPMQSEQGSAVNSQDTNYPQNDYYQGPFGHDAGYSVRNNRIPYNNDVAQPSSLQQNQESYSNTLDQKPEQRKSYFRNINNQDLSSDLNAEYNPNMQQPSVAEESQNPEQSVDSVIPEELNEGNKGSKFDWISTIAKIGGGVVNFATAIDTLMSLWKQYKPDILAEQAKQEEKSNTSTSQAEPNKLDDENFAQQEEASPVNKNTNLNKIDTNPASGCYVRYEPTQAAQSTTAESPSNESTTSTRESVDDKAQQKVHKAEPRPGVANSHVAPDELPNLDKKLNTSTLGQKTGMFGSTRPNLMKKSFVEPTELLEIETKPVVLESKNIKSYKPRLGINHGQEALENSDVVSTMSSDIDSKKISSLKARSSIGQTQSIVELPEVGSQKIIDLSSEGKTMKKVGKVNTKEFTNKIESKLHLPVELVETQEGKSYLSKVWDYVSSENTLKSLDRALTTQEGRGVIALGLASAIAAPCLAVSALTPTAVVTPAIMASATLPAVSIVPVATAATAATVIAPAATTSATAGLLAKCFSSGTALMAGKALFGLAGFAATKNPAFLIPK